MDKTILITGGSGFIGTRLTKRLLDKGYAVVDASRAPSSVRHEHLSHIYVDVTRGGLPKLLDGKIDAIIHLAGTPMFGRWSEDRKRLIRESRVGGTRNVVDSLRTWERKPSAFISASAYGYYGNKGEELVTEVMPPGNTFLAEVCRDWELESRKVEEMGIRSVQMRTAPVLGRRGFLKKIVPFFSIGLGGWSGEGKEWFPWIHIDDIVNAYVFAVEQAHMSGPYNAAAPDPIRHKELMQEIGGVMKRRVRFKVPSPLTEMVFGELAYELRNSVRMSSKKLIDAGFSFKYPGINDALADVLHGWWSK